jgi:hypothetical protein
MVAQIRFDYQVFNQELLQELLGLIFVFVLQELLVEP